MVPSKNGASDLKNQTIWSVLTVLLGGSPFRKGEVLQRAWEAFPSRRGPLFDMKHAYSTVLDSRNGKKCLSLPLMGKDRMPSGELVVDRLPDAGKPRQRKVRLGREELTREWPKWEATVGLAEPRLHAPSRFVRLFVRSSSSCLRVGPTALPTSGGKGITGRQATSVVETPKARRGERRRQREDIGRRKVRGWECGVRVAFVVTQLAPKDLSCCQDPRFLSDPRTAV